MKSLCKLLVIAILLQFYSCNTVNEAENEKVINALQLFTLLDKDQTGIDFVNKNEESSKLNIYSYDNYYHGGGVAIADFNNDNLTDIVFTANMSENKIYINKGNLKFEDITTKANINKDEDDWCTGVSILDVNKDGFQDIFISRSGWFKGEETHKLRNLLYVNNGDLTFTEKGVEYGFTTLSRTTQACFFDKDNDGDLDAYILNSPKGLAMVKTGNDGKSRVVNSDRDYSDSDKLYDNIDGKFFDKTKENGFVNCAHGLGVMASDIDNDGWLDLYIANDYSMQDGLLMNQKNGTFKYKSRTAFKHMSKFSMGLDIADINNDGLQDVFNTEMLANDNYAKKTNMASMNPIGYWRLVNSGYHYQDMHNSMQLNNGNGTFSEIAWLGNIAETDWSWCPLIADFDNDGHKDLFVSNGIKRDSRNKDFSKKFEGDLRKNPELYDPNKVVIPSREVYNTIFKNNKDLTFTDKSVDWGLNTVALNSNGAAYADLDNDGDLDLIINNIDTEAAIYENNLNKGRNYIAIQLKNGNQIPYGAKVTILDKDNFQYLELKSLHGFQSASDTKLSFGMNYQSKVDSLLIKWPNGKESIVTNLKANKLHTIDLANADIVAYKKHKKKAKAIKNVTKNIALIQGHKELEYDDYLREILIPHKQSQEGPFLDVADVNGDGLDDFFVGNGVGVAGEMFFQTSKGGFKKSDQSTFEADKLSEDLGVLFFDYDGDGDKDLYVVSGSNEHELNDPKMQDRLYQNNGKGNFKKTSNTIPKMPASGSCVIANDFDEDGDLDLFVGGFQVPGKYPQPGTSYLLQNNNGKFKDITNSIAEGLQKIGMVKDATFTDINNDGKQDLVVVGHWMPVSVYINVEGQFKNKTKAYTLSDKVGWWNTVYASDLDNDGKQDLVVGNLGLNTKHKATMEAPFKVIAKDFDNNNTNDIALGYYNNGSFYPVRGKQCSTEQIPSLKDEIKSYDQFGNLTFDDVYGKYDLSDALKLDATYFESAIFFNKGDVFEVNPLPTKSQFAPVNAIVTLDVNKDGLKEVLTVGNFHPVEVETGRYDAYIGSVTAISTDKTLKDLSHLDTGFFNDKDSRDIKEITINNKKHLVVTSNRDQIQFFEVN